MKFIDTIKGYRRSIISGHVNRRKYSSKYIVEGTIAGKDKLLYVLSGYKPYLWDDVFTRIKQYQTPDMEVCIASSGMYSNELSELCKNNGWVYISTSLNNVCVVSNIVIREFSDAKFIYKLDEDIYIPQDYFSELYKAYQIIEKEVPAQIGYICPTLPLGFYGMHKFLIDNDCLDEYEKRFGKHNMGGDTVNPAYRKHIGVDEYIWEKIGIFDECAKKYREKGFSYEACISRSGIAAIAFKRDFWERLGGLKRYRGKGFGDLGDEGQITSFCALNYQLTFCVNNLIVGHFAFGRSEPDVLKLKEKHPEYFALQK